MAACLAGKRTDRIRDDFTECQTRVGLHAPIAVMHQRFRLHDGTIVKRLLQRIQRQVAAQGGRPRQPTIRRENTSMTNATYTNPRHVATYVRSATHSGFGRTAWNCRVTRSGGRAAAVSGIVVTVNFRPRTTPARSRRRIRRATVQRATACPSRLSCCQTLRTP